METEEGIVCSVNIKAEFVLYYGWTSVEGNTWQMYTISYPQVFG